MDIIEVWCFGVFFRVAKHVQGSLSLEDMEAAAASGVLVPDSHADEGGKACQKRGLEDWIAP